MIDPLGAFAIGFAIGVLIGAVGLLLISGAIEAEDEPFDDRDLWGDHAERPK